MTKLIYKIFCLAALLWAASFFTIHRLPPPAEIAPEIYAEPAQEPDAMEPFTVTKENITYTITPLFTYDISGLLVTQHNSRSWIDISHKAWKDFLNTKDISLIWGYNIKAGDYRKLHYYHADWTGYYEYSSPVDFVGKCFSNNHLLPADDKVAKAILSAQVGDQVRAKGYLVNYSHSGGFERKTSVTRDDTGNGACEIIYVNDFTILKEGNPGWRQIHQISLYAALLCLAYMLYTLIFESPIS